MLVITRKPKQKFRVGPNVWVEVLDVIGTKVRIGIVAPTDVKIWREELLDVQEASGGRDPFLPKQAE